MYFYPFFLFYKIFIIKLASMRIKKKDVILEASLLDVSTEFNKHEKKLLKYFHRNLVREDIVVILIDLRLRHG